MKLNREPAMNMFKILRLFLDSCIFFNVTPNNNQSKCIGNQISNAKSYEKCNENEAQAIGNR